jgi:hypothetical protein
LLLRKGADAAKADKKGVQAIDVLRTREEFDTLLALVNNGAPVDKIYDEKWNTGLREFQKRLDDKDRVDRGESNNPSADAFGFYQESQKGKFFATDPVTTNAKSAKILAKAIIAKKPMKQKGKKKEYLVAMSKGGLDNSLRSEFWQFALSGGDSSDYQTLLAKPVPHSVAIQIDKDIQRTLRLQQEYFTRFDVGQCKLYRLLRAYALFDAKTVYTQGMSTIAAILLLYVPNEMEAFGAMKVLFADYSLRFWFQDGMKGIQETFTAFELFVNKKMPQLHKHLQQHIGKMLGDGQYSSLFVTNWFLELYYAVLPFPLVVRVWDMFLLKGPTIIYATGLALLSELKEKLLAANDMSVLMQVVKNTETLTFDCDSFLRRVVKFLVKEEKLPDST